MNYKKLCTGLTIEQFNDIAENWYARLNNLKEYCQKNPQSIKGNQLVLIMIERMLKVSQIYLRINASTYQPKFPKGGIATVGESGNEIILKNK